MALRRAAAARPRWPGATRRRPAPRRPPSRPAAPRPRRPSRRAPPAPTRRRRRRGWRCWRPARTRPGPARPARPRPGRRGGRRRRRSRPAGTWRSCRCRLPGAGIRSDVAVARARTRDAASATRSSGSRPACTAATTAACTASKVSSVVAEPRQSRSTPAARARTAASGMPVSALAPAMSSASLTTTPSKPRSSRSMPDHGARERGRAVRVEGGDDDVRGHDGGDAGRDGGPERGQLALVQHLDRHVDARQPVVRVDHGVTVAGEVLGAGGDPRRLEALHPGGGVARDEGRARRRSCARR